MRRLYVIVSAFLVSCLIVFGQNTASKDTHTMIEFDTDVKMIYVNELGLPPSTSLYDALRMLPELNSYGEDELSPFEVQIDDVPVGEAKATVLLQTHISEVRKVEVSTDPSAAQSSNGVTGVINIIMNPEKEGLSGNANLDVSTDFTVLPSATVCYSNGKLSVLSSLYLSYSNYDTKKESLEKIENNSYKYKNETAKLQLKYKFNTNQTFTFWLFQSFEKDDLSSQISSHRFLNDSLYNKGTQITNNPLIQSDVNALFKYEQTTDRPGEKLIASLTYSNKYSDNVSEVINEGPFYDDNLTKSYNNKYITRPNSIKGAFSYRFHLLSDTLKHSLRMKPGLNLNATFNNGSSISSYVTKGDKYMTDGDKSGTDYFDDYTRDVTFAPYLQFNYEWGPIQATAIIRYQMTALISKGEDTGWQTNTFNDFLGNISVAYLPAKDHQLKLSAGRTLNTPSNLQLFSNPYYTFFDRTWHKGDSLLTPEYFNNVKLQYVRHYSNGIHEVQLSADLEYILVVNPITSVKKMMDLIHLEYNSCQNDGKRYVIDGNISVFWRYRIFSLIVAANIYDRIDVTNKKNEIFCCMQVAPVLRFEGDWTLSNQFLFYIPFNEYLLRASLQKAWGPWSIRLSFDNFINNNLSAGFTYVF